MYPSIKSNTKPFTLKQLIVIILTKPEVHARPTATNPTVRYIQRGLKIYFNVSVTARHIRFLISELEREGVLSRNIIACTAAPHGADGQASKYIVVDFKKAFPG